MDARSGGDVGTRYIVRLDEADSGFFPASDGGGTLLRFMIDGPISGATRFAMMVNAIEPGTQDGAGVHTHATEHGFYILRGRARFVIGDEEHIVGPQTSVFMPGDVPHLVANAGDETLEYVVVYAPPGPEQDLRERFVSR
jgi:mannose-6-phosphate isomerase-like protein (cupin superfamily)